MWSAEELKTQYLQAQSQGHRIINCLEERGIERKQISLLSKDVKSHHQSDQCWKVFVGKHVGFLSKDVKKPPSVRPTLESFCLEACWSSVKRCEKLPSVRPTLESFCFNSFITVGRFCGPADPLPLSTDLFTKATFLSFLGFQRVKMNEEGIVCTLPEFSMLCMNYKVSYTVVCRIDVRSQVKSNKRTCVHVVSERWDENSILLCHL